MNLLSACSQKRLKVIEPIMAKYSEELGVDNNMCERNEFNLLHLLFIFKMKRRLSRFLLPSVSQKPTEVTLKSQKLILNSKAQKVNTCIIKADRDNNSFFPNDAKMKQNSVPSGSCWLLFPVFGG